MRELTDNEWDTLRNSIVDLVDDWDTGDLIDDVKQDKDIYYDGMSEDDLIAEYVASFGQEALDRLIVEGTDANDEPIKPVEVSANDDLRSD